MAGGPRRRFTIEPFGTDKLRQFFGCGQAYLDAYHRAVWGLVQKGFLLSKYVNNLLATSEAVPFQ